MEAEGGGRGTEGTWALPGSLGRSGLPSFVEVGIFSGPQQRAVDIKTPIYSLQCADPAAASAHSFLRSLQLQQFPAGTFFLTFTKFPATAPCSLFLKLSSIFLKPVYLRNHPFLQDIFLYLPVMDNGHTAPECSSKV